MLRRGIWETGSILPGSWIDESTAMEDGCELPDFRPRSVCYSRAWWLYPERPAQRPAIAATGHLGQFIFVFPRDELVIVRFGRQNGSDVSWPSVFQALADAVSGQGA
jgi:CubicO group peptidase (beta-lactamase class C family)